LISGAIAGLTARRSELGAAPDGANAQIANKTATDSHFAPLIMKSAPFWVGCRKASNAYKLRTGRNPTNQWSKPDGSRIAGSLATVAIGTDKICFIRIDFAREVIKVAHSIDPEAKSGCSSNYGGILSQIKAKNNLCKDQFCGIFENPAVYFNACTVGIWS
jgi:hypothetical protein